MANIKVELSHELIDGQPVTFIAPCNCTEISGLKVYYPGGSKAFVFKDAHGKVLTGLGNLFARGAYVKAILDVNNGSAYLQNADTNAYLESHINSKNNPHNVTAEQIGAVPTVRTINGHPLTEDVVITAEDLGGSGNEGLTAHINDKNNPHNVTAEQIGAAEHPRTASGDVITVNDSSNAPLRGLKLYGKTTQNGTPSPDAPVALVNAGASGEIGVTVAGDNLYYYENLSFTRHAKYTPLRPLPPGTYTLSALVTSTDTDSTVSGASFLDANEKSIGSVGLSRDVRSSGTVTINEYCYFIRFTAGMNYNSSSGDTATWTDIMLNRGDVALPYKPKYTQILVAATPNGLPGVPIQTDTAGIGKETYTDANGQRWICDTIDFQRGMYLQRVVTKVLNGTETWNTYGTANISFRHVLGALGSGINSACLCDKLSYSMVTNADGVGFRTLNSDAFGYFQVYVRLPDEYDEVVTSISTFKAWLAENPLTLMYALAEPVETPLSAEELAAYAALHTNKPNTTIYNDGVAGMEVSYFPQNAAVPIEYGTDKAGHVLTVAENGCVTSVPKANMPYVYDFGYIGEYTSDETWKDLLNECLSKMPRNGVSTATMLMLNVTIALEIYKFDEAYAVVQQRYFSSTNTVVVQERIFYNDWGEWEWENPPMISGVEYRTKERWNGKAVYTKLIDMGTYTSGIMRVAHNCGNITPIRCFGVLGDLTIPVHQCDSEDGREYDWIIGLFADGTSVEVSSHTTFPNGKNATAQLWYIKK